MIPLVVSSERGRAQTVWRRMCGVVGPLRGTLNVRRTVLKVRLGLNAIKTELEDLSFKYEHPDEYDAIEKKLTHTREQRKIIILMFVIYSFLLNPSLDNFLHHVYIK